MNQFLRFFINPGGLQKLKTAYFSLKSAVFHVFFTIIDLLLRLQPLIQILQLSIDSRQLMKQFVTFVINPGCLQQLKTTDFSLKSAVFHVFFTIIDLLLCLQLSIQTFTTPYR